MVSRHDYDVAMKKTISEKLRATIRKRKLSAKRLSALTGVDQTTISRFLAGRDMRLSRADKIAKYLGLELK